MTHSINTCAQNTRWAEMVSAGGIAARRPAENLTGVTASLFAGCGAASALCLNVAANAPGETIIHNISALIFGVDSGLMRLLAISLAIVIVGCALPRLMGARSVLASGFSGFGLLALLAVFLG